MGRPKSEETKDDRVQLRFPNKFKLNAQIRALELGYDRSKGGLSAYVMDLLKKDGVKED